MELKSVEDTSWLQLFIKNTALCKGSEIPCRVSSDLHEWRNDGQAVSTRDSVKLNSL